MQRIGPTTKLLTLVVTLFAAAAASAQSPDVVTPADEAAALLAAARKAQFSTGGAPPITSLEARLDFVVYEPEGVDKLKKVSGETEQVVSVKDGRYALRSKMSRKGRRTIDHIIDYDDQCHQIIDGVRSRLRRNKETGRDVDNLRERKRQMTRLFKLYFLGSLEVRPGSLRIVEREVVVNFMIEHRKYRFVTDRLELVDVEGNTIDAWIDRATQDVVKATIGRGADIDEFRMARYAPVPFGEDGGTVRVPHGTCVYDGGKPKLVLTGELGDIRFNTLEEDRRATLFPIKE